MTMSAKTAANKPPRTWTVSVIAWIFIVLSGYAAFDGIKQLGKAPEVMLIRYQPLLYAAISIAMLASAIGLFMRKDPARKAFIGFILLVAVWNIYVLAYVKLAYDAAIPVYTLIIVGLIFLFFAWVVRKLCSKKVRDEFVAPV